MSKTIGRLQEVLDRIPNSEIKAIIDDVFKVEISYRSMEAKNFPRQKIRDIIEDVARIVENKNQAKLK
jgi:hypothetical protein